MMQCSEIARMVERLAGIPQACPPWTIWTMDVSLTFPRCLCQVWSDGTAWAMLVCSVVGANDSAGPWVYGRLPMATVVVALMNSMHTPY